MISRTTMLDVTDLTMASVRVSDPRVASVMDGRVQGHTPGSVNITVSPMMSYELSMLSMISKSELMNRKQQNSGNKPKE